MAFSWGAACRPKGGQTVSGDAYVVIPTNEHSLLVAAIDGLGGGEEAARAAKAAVEVIQANPNRDLNEIIRLSHTALQHTRGAVLALMTLDRRDHRMAFVGVGNIGAQVYSERAIKPISKNGILGYRLPQLLNLTYTYNSGDTFVLYSDGVSSRFSLESRISLALAPQQIADQILLNYGKTTDDATVVVVRDSD